MDCFCAAHLYRRQSEFCKVIGVTDFAADTIPFATPKRVGEERPVPSSFSQDKSQGHSVPRHGDLDGKWENGIIPVGVERSTEMKATPRKAQNSALSCPARLPATRWRGIIPPHDHPTELFPPNWRRCPERWEHILLASRWVRIMSGRSGK